MMIDSTNEPFHSSSYLLNAGTPAVLFFFLPVVFLLTNENGCIRARHYMLFLSTN